MLSNKSVILTKGPDVGRFVVVNLGKYAPDHLGRHVDTGAAHGLGVVVTQGIRTQQFAQAKISKF